jgi:hypothetical protein
VRLSESMALLAPSRLVSLVSLVLLFFATACGGSSAPARSPGNADVAGSVAPSPAPPQAASPSAEPPPDSSSHVPTSCADKSADLCAPPGEFVERLCAKPHQEVALALFDKSTPFTRLYLKGKIDELLFDEEVLALRFHAQPKGGMIVGSGKGTYDVLRWDGSCSRGLEAEVLTKSRPPRPRSAHVQWHRVGGRMQNALIASSEAVKRAHSKRGKECKGAMSGDVSAACEKADGALVDAIVDYVRSGEALPAPEGM